MRSFVEEMKSDTHHYCRKDSYLRFNIMFDTFTNGSIPSLLSTVGSFLVGISIDKYGRRSALLLTVVPSTIGWFLIYCTSDISILLVAQVLNGITFGAIGYPSQVYAGECIMVNNIKLRNYFTTWTGLTTSFGTFLTFLLGYFLHYQHIAAFATLLSFTSFLCIFFFIPESPTWLYIRGRIGDAEWSRKRMGIYQSILHKSQRQDIHTRDNFTSTQITLTSIKNGFKKVTRKDVYKPLLIMTFTFILVYVAGGMNITTYMINILQFDISNSSKSKLLINTSNSDQSAFSNDSYKYSVISGGLIFIANFCASILVVRVGVRNLTKFALFCAAIGMALMGISASNMKIGSLWSTIYVPSVWLVAFMFNFGPVNITWGILGDVFPTDAKGFASVCVTIVAVFLALSNKLFLYLLDAYGGSLYLVNAIMILIASIFCHYFLPETVGKTLGQISKTFL